MTFLLVPNLQRTDALHYAAHLAARLRQAGHHAVCTAATAEALQKIGFDAELLTQQEPDMLMTLGGDGTLLRQMQLPALCEKPVWGVNFGHLGYLTDCEPTEADAAVTRLLAGEYTIEQRTVLAGEIADASGTVREHFVAANEANLCRGAMARALHMELSVNGSFVRSLSADGIIVATPTGSTAYNFSAGGPVLLPTVDCFVITAVCPYAALDCSIVTSGSDVITVRVRLPVADPESPPLLVADGTVHFVLHDGDEVRLHRAAQTLHLVRTRNQNFYDRLQKKLSQ